VVVLLTSVALVLTGIAAVRGDHGDLPVDAAPASDARSTDDAATATPPGAGLAAVSTQGLTLTAAEAEEPTSPQADPDWVAAVSRATGIPAVALAGYADASLTLGQEDAACRLGWSTLAGIGAIESGHGSHGGSVLGEDGRAFPPIIGPALDGAGFAAIRATELSTSLDGDPQWQHAVGPLQFLPSTWQRWGSDGDHDGRSDPQDVDDAALAAGRYLCASGADLTTAAGWHRAVLSYNHDEGYVAAVLVRADAYAVASTSAAVTTRP